MAGVKIRLVSVDFHPGTAGIGGEGIFHGRGAVRKRGGEVQVCAYCQTAQQQGRQYTADEFHDASFPVWRDRDKSALYYNPSFRASPKRKVYGMLIVGAAKEVYYKEQRFSLLYRGNPLK